MNLSQLAQWFDQFENNVADAAPHIIAETATEYYKESFEKKAFGDKNWEPATNVKKTGSLLIESGALVNSIEPDVVNRNQVVISAGNSKVDYAQVHNEGYKGPISIPAHTRKGKPVKAHTRQVDIPQRQFMGSVNELTERIEKRLKGFIKSITKLK